MGFGAHTTGWRCDLRLMGSFSEGSKVFLELGSMVVESKARSGFAIIIVWDLNMKHVSNGLQCKKMGMSLS